MIKDSGDRTQFNSGAVRDMHTGKGRYDLLPMCVIDRLAKHYEAGALKYSDRNWEKGIPAHSFADSAMRHFTKYMDGWDDEDHLIAAIWNLCGLAWTEVKRPEMMDIPARMNLKCCGDYDATEEAPDSKQNPSPNVSREALLHKLDNYEDSEAIKVKYVRQMIGYTGTDEDDGMPLRR